MTKHCFGEREEDVQRLKCQGNQEMRVSVVMKMAKSLKNENKVCTGCINVKFLGKHKNCNFCGLNQDKSQILAD